MNEDLDNAYAELSEKVAKGHVVTLKEFKEIVVPWVRAHRETMFELNATKEKIVRVTKKEIKARLLELVEKTIATPEAISEEDIAYVSEHFHSVSLAKKHENVLLTIPGVVPVVSVEEVTELTLEG